MHKMCCDINCVPTRNPIQRIESQDDKLCSYHLDNYSMPQNKKSIERYFLKKKKSSLIVFVEETFFMKGNRDFKK